MKKLPAEIQILGLRPRAPASIEGVSARAYAKPGALIDHGARVRRKTRKFTSVNGNASQNNSWSQIVLLTDYN